MTTDVAAAITLLESQLQATERKANGLREAINMLLEAAGQKARYQIASGSEAGRNASATQIKPDTFYGKKLQTAVREYLEMRKITSDGPATPREIFDALKSGGYQWETAEDTVALIGLRALLRKRTAFFHKLPNGTYGLTAWYPDAKSPPKGDDDDDEPSEPETTKLKIKPKPKAATD